MSNSTLSPLKTFTQPVFGLSTFFILVITFLGVVAPEVAKSFFGQLQNWLVVNTSWFYILSVGSILFFVLWLMVSRLGDIKLGPDDSEPEFSYFSWFSMLFSAGMGIGLLFFGVAEPIMHFASPPVGDPMTTESAREALKITFFHWGLHAWAIYSVVGVSMAYFAFRKDLPLLPRSVLYPLLGEKIHGPIGHAVDSFAVIGTMFGVATSLGFGVTQVNAGLNYLFSVPQILSVQVAIIAVITLLATVSVVLGLDGGIKRLSNINIVLAVLLLVFVALVGPTISLMQSYVQNTGAYLSDIVYKTFNLYAYQKKGGWLGGWTLLYWGWWVSWAPFVGIFIARISRGRTIREFLAGVLFAPTAFTFLWMTVFGNSAISQAIADSTLVDVVNDNIPVALFQFFEHLPFTTLLSLIGLTLTITFFVSSSDSGSLVIDMLASGGDPEPPVWQRVYWAVLEGLVAAILLATGGLDALQTMTIATAFPMIFFILLATVSLVKALKGDHLLLTAVQNHSTVVQYTQANSSWKERLRSLAKSPEKSDAQSFIAKTAAPALKELGQEMDSNGLRTRYKVFKNGNVRLTVVNSDRENFSYGIRLEKVQTSEVVSYRAGVYLSQGGQGYDVYGYTSEQIIADALTQYERHLHYFQKTES